MAAISPDTRFGLELVDLSDLLKNCEFKVFAGALAEGGSVRGINVKVRRLPSPAKRSTS